MPGEDDGLARRVASTSLVVLSLVFTGLPLLMFQANTRGGFEGMAAAIGAFLLSPVCFVVGLVLAILARDISKSRPRRAVARAVVVIDLLLIGLVLVFFALARGAAA